jgi:low affinity Fe/Cu permease
LRRRSSLGEALEGLAHRATEWTGGSWAFGVALAIILIWGITGPVFGFSDTWQLVINTTTTIVTFLVVFMIQNTQNRDSKALHLKLDELIRSIKGARNGLIDSEDLSDKEIDRLEDEFAKIRSRAPHLHGAPPRVQKTEPTPERE